MSASDCEDEDFEDGNNERVEMLNDQSFMDLIDQSEWDVESLLEEAPHDVHDDAAYPGFLDILIADKHFIIPCFGL